MENHGCKGCLTPSLCINYPPKLDFFKKVFFCFFLPFRICLDKIKVGGDSCLTATFRLLKSQFTVLQQSSIHFCIFICNFPCFGKCFFHVKLVCFNKNKNASHMLVSN